ncbi:MULTISPECIES: 30S ribosomal protein S5 [unclassified Adlercreutzia]|uniref:30S ribosomal protein S5 n=1 Tax=unclassified Adlercreutzia TaxID=2636013 RepID=UPI0013EB0376|nr:MULTISPECIES: 30S ribosomal protein S5 [unclassified Adlercreutzia]
MARNKQDNNAAVPELEERVVYINRVSKTVKGGRRMALTALVVVGDRNGRVGVGMGKSAEVPIAIRKGTEDAKKNMFTVPLTEAKTLPHDILGEFGAGRVLIKPATPGTGVIAGSAARAVMELAGVENVFAKSLGTDNVLNVVKAAAEGLKNMQSPQQVAERRGISVAQIYGWKETK